MKTLQVDINTAKKLYPTSDPTWKAVLEETFGKQTFSQKITDRVKSYKDALEVLGKSPIEFSPTPHVAAYEALTIVAEALNEGWFPDWNNSNQPKYYPYFDLSSGFQLSCVDFSYQSSYVGSRLCFKTRELAEYAATQFLALYEQYFTK